VVYWRNWDPDQAAAIKDNTKKVGITPEQAAIVDNISGNTR
jgi:hypothetical protein